MVIISVIIPRIGVVRGADKSSARAAAGDMERIVAAEVDTHVAANIRNVGKTMMIHIVVPAGGRSVEAPLQQAKVRRGSLRAIPSAATENR